LSCRTIAYLKMDVRNAIICDSWTNGARAHVELAKLPQYPNKVIVKSFRKGTLIFFINEVVTLSYLRNIGVTPRILGLNLGKKILILEYMDGERLLEWVLRKCSRQSVDLKDYRNIHGIDTNPVIGAAFSVFQKSKDPEITYVKNEIQKCYRKIHRRKISQGDVRPRNLICRGGSVAAIDFDLALPMARPADRDNVLLMKWYGICM